MVLLGKQYPWAGLAPFYGMSSPMTSAQDVVDREYAETAWGMVRLLQNLDVAQYAGRLRSCAGFPE